MSSNKLCDLSVQRVILPSDVQMILYIIQEVIRHLLARNHQDLVTVTV